MRRVVVVLPFVPLIETIGSRRSASRIQARPWAGCLADPRERPLDLADLPRRQLIGRPRRNIPLDEGERHLRDRRRPVAERPTARRRSSDPGRTTDGRPRRPSAPSGCARRRRRIHSASQATRAGWPDRGTVADSRTRACRSGSRRPYQRAPPADPDLDLHRRLEPVEIRTIEEADLDEAHGPARIPTARSRATLDLPP